MKKSFHEIFTEVDKETSRARKIEILRKYSSPELKTILGYTYDPRVKWLLPETTPPYTAVPDNADVEGRFYYELKKLYLFVEGNSPTQRNLKQTRREQLYIQMLESISPEDAKILIAMKDRKLPYKGLTRKLVEEAFPNLVKGW